MYIEDLIQYSTGSGKYLFHFSHITGPDQIILSSFGEQINNGDHLTEKQAFYALSLLKKHRTALLPIIADLDNDLNNPTWQYPFRVIQRDKKISIVVYEDQFSNPIKKIIVEFPYTENIVDLIRKRNSKSDSIHKARWDSVSKVWLFPYTESNISWIGSTLIPEGFNCCNDEFLEVYNSIKKIQNEIENHLPMLVKNEVGFGLRNCHRSIPHPLSTNLSETLFWAKNHAITTWDDAIEEQFQTQVDYATQLIISKPCWLSSELYPITCFRDLINYGGPTLIIIPGGSELILISEWFDFIQSLGIDSSQISVMFRLPHEKASFNQFVKEKQINNPINKDTQIAFVSTKISKPVIKSKVNFNTVINLGFYNYIHTTMKITISNARNLVYYGLTPPSTLI